MVLTRLVMSERQAVKRDRPARIRLGVILKGRENEWVALSDSMDVIATGKTVAEARQAARDKGHDLPVIVWAPASFKGFHL